MARPRKSSVSLCSRRDIDTTLSTLAHSRISCRLFGSSGATDQFKTLTFDAQTMNAASSYPQQQMLAERNIVSRARETIPGEQRSRSRHDHCESCDGEGRKSKTLVKNGEASLLCRGILGCIVLARLNHRARSIFPLRGTTLIGADMTVAL